MELKLWSNPKYTEQDIDNQTENNYYKGRRNKEKSIPVTFTFKPRYNNVNRF